MIEAGSISELQRLAWNVNQLTQVRATEAEPIKTLSRGGGKTLEVVEDSSGNKSVRRTYSPRAIDELALGRDSFRTAWTKMNRTLSQAGIEIVPSFILSESPDQTVVVSEYLEEARPLVEAPTSKKADLAEALGRIVSTKSNSFFPHIQMFRDDAFHVVKGEDGEDKILLTDVDPYSDPTSGYLLDNIPTMRDRAWGLWLLHISGLLNDFWCKPEERESVLGHLAKGALPGLMAEHDSNSFTDTMWGIQQTNMLRDGIDLRNTR